MTTKDPLDDILDVALARQRAALANRLEVDAALLAADGADPHFVAGIRRAVELVRGGTR